MCVRVCGGGGPVNLTLKNVAVMPRADTGR